MTEQTYRSRSKERKFEREFSSIIPFILVLVLAYHPGAVCSQETRRSLHDAARLGDMPTVVRLLQHEDVNASDDMGNTALHRAASRGHLAVVELLIESDADISAKDDLDTTPLHDAAREHQVDVIRALVIAGAEVDAVDHMGRTPLHKAAYSYLSGFSSTAAATVSALIEAGADVNAQDSKGISALHLAVYGGRTEAVEVLITSDANVNTKDRSGSTPLHVATWRSALPFHMESNDLIAIIDKLLQAEADVNVMNNHGETPLDSARAEENTVAFSALKAAGGRLGTK